MKSKSQIITFDLVVSIIVFMIFITIFLTLIFNIPKTKKKIDFEVEFVFDNLENNLIGYNKLNPGDDALFFSEYRINISKLINFADLFKKKSVDDFVISHLTNTHGIGMSNYTYDSCIFFTDNDGSKIDLDFDDSNSAKTVSLGYLKESGQFCNESIQSTQNPCNDYDQAISLVKPVLYDLNDVYNNRVIQMNILLCKQ
ncbi:hypothetical protein GF327_08335 [Candidatus Woesearchaeota archaeon]|nr:hypothetical protein [Candidatus Woesearchaeota archaeon]